MKFYRNLLVLVCVLSGCHAQVFAATPKKGNAVNYHKLSQRIHDLEATLVDLVNQERIKYSRRPLDTWSVLEEIAAPHSQAMAQKSIGFGHIGFEERTAELQSRATIKSFGENVGYCRNVDNPLEVIVKEWMKSKHHRANILDDYNATGIAIAVDEDGGMYFTQLFAKR